MARSLFELAVDVRFFEITPNGWIKVVAFIDEEKLRSARKIVAFKQANPDADVEVSVFESSSVIRKFKIDKADEKIEKKLRVARLLPFADTPNLWMR